jgi:transcriptional regulator with XRE-family HTH domain
METNKILANKLIELRESLGLSIRELSSKIGIPHNSISQYENMRREPAATTIAKFAIFFNVSSDYLLGLSNQKGEVKQL